MKKQYFLLEHSETKKEIQIDFEIGDNGISGFDFLPKMKKAFKDKNEQFTDMWNIKKAWCM